MRPLSHPRPLRELADETSGQLITEWVLLTAAIVIPLLLAIPTAIGMIRSYFYRIADVVCLPFP